MIQASLRSVLVSRQTAARFALLAALLLAPATAARAQVSDKWGPDVRGIQVAVRLSDGRKEFHPGEVLKWLILVKHAGTTPLHLPWNDNGNHVTVHVETPAGAKYIYRPPFTKTANHWRASTGSSGWVAKSGLWRLADNSYDGWVGAKKLDSQVAISLRKSGTYRMWAEYEVVPGKDAPADAWQGAAVSEVVEWTVSELPLGRRNAGLTAQQELDLRDWLVLPPSGARSAAWNRIHDALAWTENEGLALRVASAVLREPGHALEGLYLLGYRSGIAKEIGIDGPYLKEAANAVLLVGEDRIAVERRWTGTNQYPLVAVYLQLHPDDAALKDRVVALARTHCKLAEDGTWLRPATRNECAGMPLLTAWDFLLQTEVLYAGMPIEEAVEILGKPTENENQQMAWILKSQSRGITMLGAMHDENKITSWAGR